MLFMSLERNDLDIYEDSEGQRHIVPADGTPFDLWLEQSSDERPLRRQGRWMGCVGMVKRPKIRGQVNRDDWMCQMFGADWRTNGRVAPRKGTAVL